MMPQLFQQDWRETWSGLTVPESGSVYTKPEIVALILDLLGYTSETSDLLGRRLLEPSCGDGAFITEIFTRLITSPTWDLRKLQTLLQSDMVTDQLRAHSVAMRGGSLRYQAQNLRRVRIPV